MNISNSVRSTKNIHKKIYTNNSAFAHCAVTALVIGFGSVTALITDILWLLGDMSMGAHWYHKFILIGLVTALGITVASFIWLYRSISIYLVKHENVKINKKKQSKKPVASEVTEECKTCYEELN